MNGSMRRQRADPVGASLLAMRFVLSINNRLTLRYREQARSYRKRHFTNTYVCELISF